MRYMSYKQALFTVLMLTLCEPLAAQAASSQVWSTNFSRTYDFAPGSTFVIDNRIGNVVIEGVGGSKLDVRAKLTIRGANAAAVTNGRESITLHSNLIPGGRMIRTAGNDPGQRGWEATVDYYIRLPRSCNVSITSVASPLVQTTDLTGNLQITNFSGMIDITATGAPMAVDTTNGDIVVRLKGTPRGDSRLRTLNGSVRLFARPDLAFTWIAESVSGRVRASREITTDVVRPASNRNRWVAAINGGQNKVLAASMTGELLLGPLADAPAEISPGLGTGRSGVPTSQPRSEELIEVVSRFLLQRPGARKFAFQQNRVPDQLDFSTRMGNIIAVEVNEATVSTGAGEIVVGRALGNLKATTNGGPINIGETFGTLEVETDAGDILINSANKGGYARTGGGNIHVRSTTGPLRLISGGGDVTVEQAADSVTVRTQSGDVTIDVPQGVQRLSLDLETTGGNVILTLPQGLRANVDATVITSDAEINTIDSTVSGLAIVRDVIGGKSRIRATGSLNGGGPTLKIVVQEGNIQLRQSRSR